MLAIKSRSGAKDITVGVVTAMADRVKDFGDARTEASKNYQAMVPEGVPVPGRWSGVSQKL